MNESKDKRKPPSQDSWAFFFWYTERQWKKVASVLGIAATLFTGGIFVGRLYENLQNKFEISDLKTKYNAEIQQIKDEHFQQQIKEMKTQQWNLNNLRFSGKEVADEK